MFLSSNQEKVLLRTNNSVRESLNLDSGFFLFPLIFGYILVQVREKILSTQFLIKMKKNLFALLSIATILLAGCTDTQEVKIDVENIAPEELSEIEQTFNAQINEAQYIKDLEDFISYDISLNTEGKPFVSNIVFDADFGENSSVQ